MPSAQHLMRFWRSVPLPNLSQGSTLSIRSRITPSFPLQVHLQPAWRDDGHIELNQVFHESNEGDSRQEKEEQVQMLVDEKGSKKTSMGRTSAHISIVLESPQSSSKGVVSEQHSFTQDHDRIIHHSKSKSVDKVMFDDGTIVPDSEELAASQGGQEGLRRVEYTDGIAHLTKTGTSAAKEEDQAGGLSSGTFLNVAVPEKVNLDVELETGGSIVVSGKVEGDVKLTTTEGDISVTKLRGHNLVLIAGHSSTGKEDNSRITTSGTDQSSNIIYAKDLLEADKLVISTLGRVRAKQIHGRSVRIAVNRQYVPEGTIIPQDEDDEGSYVDLGALFVSGKDGAASVEVNVDPKQAMSRRAVRVKSHHGQLQVVAKGLSRPTDVNPLVHETYPAVELGGVNGGCEVILESSDQLDTSKGVEDPWKSCCVHFDSLSPESVSLVSVDRGDTSITLDRKLESDLRLLSVSDSECLTEAGALIAEEEDREMIVNVLRHLPSNRTRSSNQFVNIDTSAFAPAQASLETDSLMYVEGWVENKSNELDSRFEIKSRGSASSVGKIRLDGAADQALKAFSPSDHNDDTYADIRPLIAVATSGKISVETVSWLGAIARRYGLEDSEAKRKAGGRTASRKGRPIVPID